MALKVPRTVMKVLRKHSNSFGSDADIHTLFRELRKILRLPERWDEGLGAVTGGVFNLVLICRGYVIKCARPDPCHPRTCDIRRDYKFIRKMRSNPRLRVHFPDSLIIGNIMIQERCNVNYDRFNDWEDSIQRLADRIGVEDIHEENIGWKKVKGEWTPVFIDVGFRTRPRRRWKRNPRIPRWVRNLEKR